MDIRPTDILTNLPYAPQAHLVFDHHHSETLRVEGKPDNHIIDASAPSAARVSTTTTAGWPASRTCRST